MSAQVLPIAEVDRVRALIAASEALVAEVTATVEQMGCVSSITDADVRADRRRVRDALARAQRLLVRTVDALEVAELLIAAPEPKA